MMERVLDAGLDGRNALTPAQLRDLCTIFLSVMHLRKVTPEYWVAKSELPFKLYATLSYVEAENSLRKVDGLPEATVKVLEGAVMLSLQEISKLRGMLREEVKLLAQCAPPGAAIH